MLQNKIYYGKLDPLSSTDFSSSTFTLFAGGSSLVDAVPKGAEEEDPVAPKPNTVGAVFITEDEEVEVAVLPKPIVVPIPLLEDMLLNIADD